jgi:hypothetical protein
MGTSCMAQIVANQVNTGSAVDCLNATISAYACSGFQSGTCTLTFHRSGVLNIISFNGTYDETVVMAGITRATHVTFAHHTYPSKSGGNSYVGAVTMSGVTGAAVYQTLNSPYPVPTGASTYKFRSADGGMSGISTIGAPIVTNNGGNFVMIYPSADDRITFNLCAPIVGSGK